ncbi:MAG: hypothetical protein H6Q13_1653 [Bacteroidetes bacterium]|nr:hypothetical protein [Bacteroidota bacterium]
MNINELRQAQADYFVEETIERRKDLHTIRARFTRDFSVKQITEMSIDDYIIGKNIKTTFCYRIERL